MPISFPGFVKETPEARLDRLVLARLFYVTDDGFAMHCYLCKTLVATPPFTSNHAWFELAGDTYNEHVGACYEAGNGSQRGDTP